MSQHWTYSKGLKDLGNGSYAYLQPDGGWGWSNAGLVVDGDQSLLVDTLFDMELTREMLGVMQDATGVRGDSIDTVVNTHANGDHTHGNGCCPKAEIVASEASAREMEELPASALAQIMAAAPELGEVGAYLTDIFGHYNFAGVEERLPTRTFSGALELKVGDRSVQLIEVGPAHTAGDVITWLPDTRTVYTGDILFIESTPIMWAGPVRNWLDACDRILALDAEAIVPGHGPITDAQGVKRVQDYLRYIDGEARRRYDAGLSIRDAAMDISLGDYSNWGDAERIAVNVATLYQEYGNYETEAPSVVELFTLMCEIRASLRGA